MTPDPETLALRAAYQAARRILRARDEAGAQEAVFWLCEQLGATPISAEAPDEGTLPIDLIVGDAEPMLPLVRPGGSAVLITRYLPAAIADARHVVERSSGAARLVERATLDPLTGLWNRRSLEMAINRTSSGDCLAMVDLDHFKLVNDNHGHDVGDEVLVSFSAHLRVGVRDRDVVGRLGGEEFVVVFPDTPVADAVAALSRVRASWPSIAPLPITFSAGVVSVPDNGEPGALAGRSALRAADMLMYQAKHAGRDVILQEG